LLDIEVILALFWDNTQFMQKVGVEVNRLPGVLTSVDSLATLALAGIIELVNNSPGEFDRLTSSSNAVNEAWIFNR